LQQTKRGTKTEIPYDAQASESESHLAINSIPDRDDDANPPTTPGPTSSAINLESSTKDLAPQGIISADSANSRLRTTEPTTNPEQQQQQQQQQTRVQFVPVNNYYKNVSDNKDVAKLVSLLVTCINATKKVVLNLIYY
jgi:hypothetical protein